MVDYFHSQQAEETEIQSKLDEIIPHSATHQPSA
jgi:hypothetical protein